MSSRKIRVLIVDDSALVREILANGLQQDPMLEVVGTAPDAYVARDKIVHLQPDVLTLDIEMPRMDGLEFLRKLMPQYPIPVVIVSSLTQRGKQITLQALEAGAVDFVAKPAADVARGLRNMIMELRTKIKIASTTNVAHWKRNRWNAHPQTVFQTQALSESTDKIIAIGASTGGTVAITNVITQFPPSMPGVVIVQHMPPGFTKLFADRLNEQCAMDVKEAEPEDRIMTGRILIAPGGDQHLQIVRSGGIYKVKLIDGPKVNGHCPSVDVMMKSVAEYAGSNAYGILLTGMGNDGARGMKTMKDAGSVNIAQDEKTSVVYGMPKCAYELGAADWVLPIHQIAAKLIAILQGE